MMSECLLTFAVVCCCLLFVVCCSVIQYDYAFLVGWLLYFYFYFKHSHSDIIQLQNIELPDDKVNCSELLSQSIVALHLYRITVYVVDTQLKRHIRVNQMEIYQ